jgi:hypothetical protein
MTNTKVTVTDPVTTDPVELAEVLRGLPWHQRGEIRDRLVVQLGDEDAAWRLYDSVESGVRHEESVTRLRAELRQALVAIETDLRRVTGVLDELSSDVYDVEYAEGGASDDMRAFLADAARMVRAALALNPCAAEADEAGR